MYQVKNNIYFIKVFLKVTLSIICYLFFTLYTVPMYHNVRAYVDEKMFLTKRALVVGETNIIVDVVDTPESRQLGLSGRKNLEQGHGMLFVFQLSDMHGFWMKDMNFNIDIIWFNEYGEVSYYVENISPDTYPTVFAPPTKSLYVLEVPFGFVKEKGIKLGDKIDLY